jgi:hypothetical protein
VVVDVLVSVGRTYRVDVVVVKLDEVVMLIVTFHGTVPFQSVQSVQLPPRDPL